MMARSRRGAGGDHPSERAWQDRESVGYEVRLTNIAAPVAGVYFRLEYPVAALRLLGAEWHMAGTLVPVGSAAQWNVSPSGDDYAAQNGVLSFVASSATPWPQERACWHD
jgi:hypothetical protein